jgi:hypothetical protein
VLNAFAQFQNAKKFNQDLSKWVFNMTLQPSAFSLGANSTFANNANLKKPFLKGGVTRVNT